MSSRNAWTPKRLRALGPTTDLTTAAEILGISRSAAYKFARRGAFPAPLLRVSAVYRVPTAPLLAAHVTDTHLRAVQVVSDVLFAHPAVTTHATPYTIIEMGVTDAAVGPHRHIDLVYVLRALPGDLTAQLDEVAGARWVPVDGLAELDTPVELPALITAAASWAKHHLRPSPTASV